jgi:cellulose synthase/poly-beta-1,6-N-acetylglucosamine synthase-like glycosyltransferase
VSAMPSMTDAATGRGTRPAPVRTQNTISHWILFAGVLGMLAVMLSFDTLVRVVAGTSAPTGGVSGQALALAHGMSSTTLTLLFWATLLLSGIGLLRTLLIVVIPLMKRRQHRLPREPRGPERHRFHRDRPNHRQGVVKAPRQTSGADLQGNAGGQGFLPPVSVVVPAYNETMGIEDTVRSLVASDYPDLEVVVVDDGSTDGTAEVVTRLALPGVVVVRQDNAGKSAALRHGIRIAKAEILILLDGDTVFEPDTIRRLVQPLADPKIGAVAGNTKVGNRNRLLGRWQHIEYVQSFSLDRHLYHLIGVMPTVPGAVGAWRRRALEECGGFKDDTLAEDTEATMGLCRAGWRVAYADDANAWTEAPSSLRVLWRQRYRWCYGTMQAMWKHRRAVVEGGRLGRIVIPYLVVFQVLMQLLAPLVDLITLYSVAFGGFSFVPMVCFQVVQLATGAYALHLDRERPTSLWALPLQMFCYRQLMYLVVIQSLVTAARGTPLRWQRMIRTGTASATLTKPEAAAA